MASYPVLVGAYTVGCVAVHAASSTFWKSALPDIYGKFAPTEKELHKRAAKGKPFQATDLQEYLFVQQVEWDVMVSSLIYCFVLSCLYLYHTWDVLAHGTAADRWGTVSTVSAHAICLHLASSLYETLTYVVAGKGWMFYLHHVLVVLSCGSFLLTDRGHLWCCWLGLVEATNVPLCLVTLYNKVPSAKGSLPHIVAGALLWVMYVIFRVVSAPMCMYWMYGDYQNTPEHAWVSKDVSLDRGWLVLMIFSFAFIWGLSMYWFKLITNGLLKHILPQKADEKKQ